VTPRYAAALGELRELVSATESGDTRLDSALKIIGAALETPLAKVLELVASGNHLVVRAGVGWRDGVTGQVTVPVGPTSSAGYALTHDRAVIFDDIQGTRRLTDATLLRSHNVMSSLAVRIADGRGVLGVLSVHERRRRRFSSGEAAFIEAAAAIVAALM
jgi:GAF domain-containing protein